MFTHYQKDPNCEVCKMNKTARVKCKVKPVKRADEIAPSTTLGDLLTAGHTNSERGKRVKVRTQETL